MPPKGTIGLALAAYKMWNRLPPQQRAVVFNQLRKHGPKAAAAAAAFYQSRKKGSGGQTRPGPPTS